MSTSVLKAGPRSRVSSKRSAPAPKPTLSGEGNRRPRLALTMGDPRGIGPEVLLKALAHPRVAGQLEPQLVGVRRILEEEARRLWPEGLPEAVRAAFKTVVEVEEDLPDALPGLQQRDYLLARPALCGRWAGRAVELAVGLVRAGNVAAVVTAPLDKYALNLGGYHFAGHTEMLSHLAGDCRVAMMLVGGSLRVVPATTHVALSRVPELFTSELLLGQLQVVDASLRRLFGLERPVIALCGLNPHLGDGGLAGEEDLKVTGPAAEEARRLGIDVRGPFAADTVFVRAARGEFDAVLAAYHDQAMVAVKMHAFGRGVNLTLGLPFIRTSPDHGTAMDIAGGETADETSMVEAVLLAARLGGNQPGWKER